MCVCVCVQWSGIFPTEQVTQQQSALFVKKLLAVAVSEMVSFFNVLLNFGSLAQISNITYLRTIFPEHAFGDRCLEGVVMCM